jgi:HPt (histidine-containing phosphotransfer) domain-containing protein
VPVTETPLHSAVFDQLQLAMTGNPIGFAELYRDYLTDAWESLQVLREGAQRRDGEAVRARAHYLRSSSLVVGAQVVARQAAMLEEAASGSESQGVRSLLDDLGRSLKEVQMELAERLGGGVIPASEAATETSVQTG